MGLKYGITRGIKYISRRKRALNKKGFSRICRRQNKLFCKKFWLEGEEPYNKPRGYVG